MKSSRSRLTAGLALAYAAISLGLAAGIQAQTFSTLASFDGQNGQEPFYVSLVQATNGNYYGTTYYGGTHGILGNGGTVFEVTPAGTLSDVYNFCVYDCVDGDLPTAGLVLGTDANLYGTTPRRGRQERWQCFQGNYHGQADSTLRLLLTSQLRRRLVP